MQFTPSMAPRSRFARPSIESDERKARYAFLSPLVEGALAIELLSPRQAKFPGAPFLEFLGASSTASICCTPEEPPTAQALDEVAAKSIGESPLVFVEDGVSWIQSEESLAALDALVQGIDSRLPRARYVFTFRNPSGVSLAAFGESADRCAGRFDFMAAEKALAQRFPLVRFATQSALWGYQLAPLSGGQLDNAIDGRLGDVPKAAFFIALCTRERSVALPGELTLVPLPLAHLAAGAERFHKLSEALSRATEETARLESSLHARGEDRRRLDDLERQAKESESASKAADERCRQAEERLARAESLLDEVAEERSRLMARLEQVQSRLQAAEGELGESKRLQEAASGERDRATREREAHLAISQTAMKRLQDQIASLKSENSLLASSRRSEGPSPSDPAAKPDAAASQDVHGVAKPENAQDAPSGADLPCAATSELEELRSKLDACLKAKSALEATVARQDERIEELEESASRLNQTEASRVQSDAKEAGLEARLAELELERDSLSADLRKLARAADELARRRDGEAITRLLELHDAMLQDHPETYSSHGSDIHSDESDEGPDEEGEADGWEG